MALVRGLELTRNMRATTEVADRVVEAWVADLSSELTQDESGYVGFLVDEGEDRVRMAYPGSTWDRLREVKRQYDPDNLFRLNQNIKPTG